MRICTAVPRSRACNGRREAERGGGSAGRGHHRGQPAGGNAQRGRLCVAGHSARPDAQPHRCARACLFWTPACGCGSAVVAVWLLKTRDGTGRACLVSSYLHGIAQDPIWHQQANAAWLSNPQRRSCTLPVMLPSAIPLLAHAVSTVAVRAGAVADFTKAVEMEPRYNESWKRRGQARSALGENEAALQVHGQTVPCSPLHPASFCVMSLASSASSRSGQGGVAPFAQFRDSPRCSLMSRARFCVDGERPNPNPNPNPPGSCGKGLGGCRT